MYVLNGIFVNRRINFVIWVIWLLLASKSENTNVSFEAQWVVNLWSFCSRFCLQYLLTFSDYRVSITASVEVVLVCNFPFVTVCSLLVRVVIVCFFSGRSSVQVRLHHLFPRRPAEDTCEEDLWGVSPLTCFWYINYFPSLNLESLL